jgi:hypothetical protein
MPLRMLRYLDLYVLALALPIFVAADLPLLGWAGAAVGWIVQRLIATGITKRAQESGDPRTVAGLSAAILSITLFTFYFTSQLMTRPFEQERP